MILLSGTGKTALLVLVTLATALGAGIYLIGLPPRSLADLPAPQRAEFRRLHRQALEELRLEQWEGANADLVRCLSIFDRDPDIHFLLGKVYMGWRRPGAPPGEATVEEEDALVDRALAYLDRALEIDPENIPALRARFQILQNPTLRRYDPDRAMADGEEVLRIAPENSGFRHWFIMWLLGPVRFRRGPETKMAFDSSIGVEVAERHTEYIMDGAPVGSDAYAQALHGLGVVQTYMGDFERAAETLLSLDDVPLEPKIRARNLVDLGFAYYRAGKYKAASGALLRSLDEKKTLEAAWLLRLAYDGLGKDAGDLPEKYRFPLPPESFDPDHPPDLRFTEVGEELGVAKLDGAGPSAFADYDGDGDPDILAAGCDTYTVLYRNDGNRFRDVTIEAGLANLESGFSTNLVDYDDDGHLDIYVCRNGWSGQARNILYRNMGDGTFEDVSGESGLDDPGCGFVSLWADFDRDGDLDVYIVNGVLQEGSTNRLYRNGGEGTFEDVTEPAGLGESPRWGTIGAAIGDYDRDGDPDIFVNGRDEAPNRLYRNKGDGTFDEVAKEAGVTAPQHNGYVAFFIDYDNDAHPDIFTTSLARWKFVLKGMSRQVVPGGPEQVQSDAPRLYRNNRDGTFSDVTYQAGLAFPLGIMGATVGDLDNDGHLDLYLGTGDPDLKRLEPTVFYHNNGDGTFSDLTRFTGLGHLGKGHGLSLADFDGDGDLDVYAPQGGFFHGDQWANPLYRNESGAGNHWVHFRLRGTTSNRFAVGAQVTLKSGGMTQYREVTGGIGFGSTNSYPVEFGLGEKIRIDEVEIIWPTGKRQVLLSPPVDSLMEVVESRQGWRIIHTGRGG